MGESDPSIRRELPKGSDVPRSWHYGFVFHVVPTALQREAVDEALMDGEVYLVGKWDMRLGTWVARVHRMDDDSEVADIPNDIAKHVLPLAMAGYLRLGVNALSLDGAWVDIFFYTFTRDGTHERLLGANIFKRMGSAPLEGVA